MDGDAELIVGVVRDYFEGWFEGMLCGWGGRCIGIW